MYTHGDDDPERSDKFISKVQGTGVSDNLCHIQTSCNDINYRGCIPPGQPSHQHRLSIPQLEPSPRQLIEQ